MKKITLTLTLLFVCFNSVLFAETEIKPKLRMSIFANETTCWTCLTSIKTIQNLKLVNYQLEIRIFFCSENSEMLDRLMNEHKIKCKTILDPDCLYAKKYAFSTLPAIIVEDRERDTIIISEHWNKPQEYLNKIMEYDKNYKPFEKQSNADFNFNKSLLIKESDGTPMNIRYSDIVYNSKYNKYYCFLRSEEDRISILDSNGLLEEEINLREYSEVEEFFSNESPYFISDSILVWRNISRKIRGQKNIFGMNINTKKIIKYGIIDSSHTTNNSSVHYFIPVPQTNKLVFAKYYFANTTINKDEKLLLMTDTNYYPLKYFGKVDPVVETTTLAGHIMTFPGAPAVCDNYIYYLMNLSNQLYVFDIEGNYVKTIELQFDEYYNPPLINIPARASDDEMDEIYSKYKHNWQFFVQKDKIITIGTSIKINEETLKRESTPYITIFDKEGKKISNTFALPSKIRVRDQMIGNELLVTAEGSKPGSLIIHWFDISNLLK